MADSTGGKKKKKRRARKGGGGGASGTTGDKDDRLDPEDILRLVKEQLQIAKDNKDHAMAGKLREQVWVLTDMVAGVKTDIPEEELAAILENLPIQNSDKKNENEAPTTTSILSEPEKRVRNMKKKLDQIEKLKGKQANGEKLEANQVEKINSEAKLREEIEELEEIIQSTLKLTL